MDGQPDGVHPRLHWNGWHQMPRQFPNDADAMDGHAALERSVKTSVSANARSRCYAGHPAHRPSHYDNGGVAGNGISSLKVAKHGGYENENRLPLPGHP